MIKELQRTIGYTFENTKTLHEALTHPSIRSIHKKKTSYQRLEFLGDTVLSMVIAELLFVTFPNENEGDLSRRHIELVKGNTLAKVATQIKLGDFICMSNSERENGGIKNIRNLENTMEALIASIYIDGGIEDAKNFILKYWKPILSAMKSPPENVKSKLQEWAQQNALPIPTYRTVSTTGPPHSPLFSIELQLQGFTPVVVIAKSKRQGEQLAADKMLKEYILNKS